MGRKGKGAARVEPSSSSSSSTAQAQAPKEPPPLPTVKCPSLESLVVDVEYESSLEKLMNKASDEASLKVFTQAWNKHVRNKLELHEANSKVSYEEFEKLIASKKLDSNLKKCTGFVRKLRQYTESQKSSIENDVKTLNLSKYLTEIATAITEARFKIDHVNDAVAVCSLLHQRYSEFSGLIVENYQKSFPTKKTEMNASLVNKLSVDIRMLGDLIICGVVVPREGCLLLMGLLKNLAASDKEGLQCLIPIMSFASGLGDSFLGILPRKVSILCQTHNVVLEKNDTLSPEIKGAFKKIILEYFSCVYKSLDKVHQEKQKSELYNRKLLKTKGEIPPERKEDHLGIQTKFDKYYITATKFADVVNCDLPVLTDLPADPEEEEEKALLRSESGEMMDTVPGIILFEDEETRAFYQDFKDLKVYLPPVAYRESLQQTAAEIQQIEEREKAINDFDDDVETEELKQETEEEEAPSEMDANTDLPPSCRTDSEEKEADIPIKPNFEQYLNNLLNCGGRNTIDKAALDFAENHNIKPNRKKLVHTLFRIPRQRIDLIPFYSRLVAILNPVMPDVGIELCRLLKNDFFFLVKKKHQIFIETKLKIVRFIGELINFRIFPKSDALQCLKVLLMNFVHHQIDMACVLVEICGRVLYRTPDSHRRMKIYLEEMMRKKTVRSLEARYVSMIDHAYSIVLPREEAPRIIRKKTAIELMLEPILLENLNKETYKIALTNLKLLHWRDEEASQTVCQLMTCPWKITHQQLQLQAQLLTELAKSEPFAVTRIVDIVMEEVRRGLENPGIHFNHRRFSTLSYVAELYYYRLIRTECLFDILFLLITYGVSWDPLKVSAMDPPDNLYRVRLACFLLKDCGEYLNHGGNKKRLRLYLVHLQKYYWLKRSLPFWMQHRFPFGVYEALTETSRQFYPKMIFAANLEEAIQILEQFENEDEDVDTEGNHIRKLMPISQMNEFQMLGYNDDINMCQPGPSNPYFLYPNQGACSNTAPWNNQAAGFELGDQPPQENDFQKMLPPYEPPEKLHSPEDEEFIAMFDKMCAEVNYTGKQLKTEITIPLQISNSSHSTSIVNKNANGSGADNGTPSDTVPFVLMTRKGNKQQFKTLSVPADSEFVQKIKDRDEMERKEKESVKKRTLAISQLQEAEERQREVDAIKTSFISTTRDAGGNKYKAKEKREEVDIENGGSGDASMHPAEDSESESSDSDMYDDLEINLGPNVSKSNHTMFQKWTQKNKNKIVQVDNVNFPKNRKPVNRKRLTLKTITSSFS